MSFTYLSAIFFQAKNIVLWIVVCLFIACVQTPEALSEEEVTGFPASSEEPIKVQCEKIKRSHYQLIY